MYENEVQIQSSISVAFAATYNHFQTELALFFYDILVKKKVKQKIRPIDNDYFVSVWDLRNFTTIEKYDWGENDRRNEAELKTNDSRGCTRCIVTNRSRSYVTSSYLTWDVC